MPVGTGLKRACGRIRAEWSCLRRKAMSHLNYQPAIVSHNSSVSPSLFREKFLEGFADLIKGSRTLRQIVPACIRAGFSRSDLVQWGVDAGYSAAHVRSVISKILCRSGVRERRPGGGRRT